MPKKEWKRKRTPDKPHQDERVSLAPLSAEDALRGLLEVDPKLVQKHMDELRQRQDRRSTKQDQERDAAPSEQ